MKELDFEKLYPNRGDAPKEEEDYYHQDLPDITPEDENAKEEKIDSLKQEVEGGFMISPQEAGERDGQELDRFVRESTTEIIKQNPSIGMVRLGELIVERQEVIFYPEKMEEIEDDARVWVEIMMQDIEGNKNCLDNFKNKEYSKTLQKLIEKKDLEKIKELLTSVYVVERIDALRSYTGSNGEGSSENLNSPFEEGYIPDDLQGKDSEDKSPFKKGYEPKKPGQKKWWQFWR